jgi:hypothetical protein
MHVGHVNSVESRIYTEDILMDADMKGASYWRSIFITVFVTGLYSVSYYTCFVWMAYFLSDDIPVRNAVPGAYFLVFGANIFLSLLLPIAGAIGDFVGWLNSNNVGGYRKGYQIVMMTAIWLMLISAIPSFMMLSDDSITMILVGMGMLATATALFAGNLPAFMVSQFPAMQRYSGIGIAYNIANALFAGTAPTIQTALVMSSFGGDDIDHTQADDVNTDTTIIEYLLHDRLIRPAYWLMIVAMISLCAMAFCISNDDGSSTPEGTTQDTTGSASPYRNDYMRNKVSPDSMRKSPMPPSMTASSAISAEQESQNSSISAALQSKDTQDNMDTSAFRVTSRPMKLYEDLVRVARSAYSNLKWKDDTNDSAYVELSRAYDDLSTHSYTTNGTETSADLFNKGTKQHKRGVSV